MDCLDFIPSGIFEVIGIVAGLVCCAVVLVQTVKEWRDKNPSTMATIYVVGWLGVFAFWMLYGIRFRAVALGLTNGIAVLIQTALLIIVLRKKQ